jgi:glyoxylase-like metal-dependent hydrolase (beta-lactamase superfamily II)
MKQKKILWLILAGVLIILLIGFIFLLPAFRFYTHSEEIKLNDNLLVITGGGNSGILITEKAIVVIDTKMGSGAEKLADRARELAGNKPIVVINTHLHGDHVRGNYLYPGSEKFMGAYDTLFLKQKVEEENLPVFLVEDSVILDMGDELLVLRNMGNAHTYDDLVVYLPYHRILFTGDLVLNKINPPLFKDAGASVKGWLHVLDLIKADYQPLTIIPGHGKPGGPELIEELEEYFTDMKSAADDPVLKKQIMVKYKDWTKIPFMTSPSRTIDYILQEELTK